MLEQINDGIKIVAEDQSGMSKDIKAIKSDISGIKSDIDVMQGDIASIKYDLKEKASQEDFEKMEKRVVKLEKLVFAKLM